MGPLAPRIAEAQNRAHTDIEKQRVTPWHDPIGNWIVDGRAAYIAKAQHTYP